MELKSKHTETEMVRIMKRPNKLLARDIEIVNSATQIFENLITKESLAEKLSISQSYVSKLMVKGMPRVNIGRAVRFRFSEVVAFIERTR